MWEITCFQNISQYVLTWPLLILQIFIYIKWKVQYNNTFRMYKKRNIIWDNTNRSRQIRMQGSECVSVFCYTWVMFPVGKIQVSWEVQQPGLDYLTSKFSNTTVTISDLLFPILLKREDNIFCRANLDSKLRICCRYFWKGLYLLQCAFRFTSLNFFSW